MLELDKMEGMDGRMSIGREGEVLRENQELQNEVQYLRLMVCVL